MFCAGLLLSIADLLDFVDCDIPAAGPQAQWTGSKQQHVPGSLPAATGTRGDNPAGPRLTGSAIPAVQMSVPYGDLRRISTESYRKTVPELTLQRCREQTCGRI